MPKNRAACFFLIHDVFAEIVVHPLCNTQRLLQILAFHTQVTLQLNAFFSILYNHLLDFVRCFIHRLISTMHQT